MEPSTTSFLGDWDHYLKLPGVPAPGKREASYTFAGFFQIHRAFYHIFEHIIGSSLSAARLRAAVWQSIFTHDMRRYRRFFYDRMGDFATLITGPSGTGKELVARAIALSRYHPISTRRSRTFGNDLQDSFHPINLAALSPTLIESELFGHRRGSLHRCPAGPARLVGALPTTGLGLPGRDRRPGPVRPGQTSSG